MHREQRNIFSSRWIPQALQLGCANNADVSVVVGDAVDDVVDDDTNVGAEDGVEDGDDGTHYPLCKHFVQIGLNLE